MKKVFSYSWILALGILLVSSACKTSKTVKGAAIGGAVGGVIGGIIGKKSGNTAAGVIVGSAIGGSSGAVIGKYMDKQAKEIEDSLEEGVEVERVGEGILVTFDSGLLFEYGKSGLTAATKENLDKLAETLKKYADTDLLIEGHTDDKGSEAFNQTLSEQRAQAVSSYLASKGVPNARFTIKGHGEMKPVTDNTTDAGRAANRRVEIAITANEKLKEDAANGDVKVD